MSACCSPRMKSGSKDVCGFCTGCYPNGLVSLLLAQVLILLGFMLSALSLIDCRFVKADVFGIDSFPPGNLTEWEPDSRTGFGFVMYQNASGTCTLASWADEMEHAEDNHVTNMTSAEEYFSDYIEWLGDDWDQGRYFLGSAVGAAFVTLSWVIAMMCIAHVWNLRILAAAIPIFVIMPLQFASLSVLDSDFCQERSCDLDRSGIASMCAGFMYFAGGITLLFTKGYTPKSREESAAQSILQQQSRSTRSQRSAEPAEVEMVDIVHDASFIIEEDRARTNANEVQEEVIGDGLAEAQEIKPDMVFLHEDGEAHEDGRTGTTVPATADAPAPAEQNIPTVTEVHIIDEVSKTKVAP